MRFNTRLPDEGYNVRTNCSEGQTLSRVFSNEIVVALFVGMTVGTDVRSV